MIQIEFVAMLCPAPANWAMFMSAWELVLRAVEPIALVGETITEELA